MTQRRQPRTTVLAVMLSVVSGIAALGAAKGCIFNALDLQSAQAASAAHESMDKARSEEMKEISKSLTKHGTMLEFLVEAQKKDVK